MFGSCRKFFIENLLVSKAASEPGSLLKESVSKWSSHSLECSLTGVFDHRIFASHLESSSLFSSGKRCQDFLIFMSEEFGQP